MKLTGAGSPLLLVALAVVCLAPLAGKAFHVDDPLFLWMAQQIRDAPLDPYGFKVNWYGHDEPAAAVLKNPPGMGYVLAALAWVFGAREVGLHLALLLPALGTLLGTWFLARELRADPWIAALAALASPVFLISATQVMCDVSMLCLWVWALWFWIRGIEDRRPWKLCVAALLTAAAALTKYFGASLVPLLLAHGWMRRRSLGSWLAWLAIPLGVLGLYQAWSTATYGRGLLLDAAAYAEGRRLLHDPRTIDQTLTGLSFTGGGLPCILFLSAWLWSRRVLAGTAAVWVGAVVLLPLAGTVGSLVLWGDAGPRFAEAAQLGLMVVLGLGWLALALDDLRSERDAGAVLLSLWFLGTFVFGTFVNWSVNGRSILPLVPAAGLLLARRWRTARPAAPATPALVALLVALALALFPAWADLRLANSGRTAAARITSGHGGAGTIWFTGHWGFQYYMQVHGAVAIPLESAELDPGDVLVTPSNNTNLFQFPAEALEQAEVVELVPSRWLSTMSAGRAGFYTDVWGPLPYALGPVRPETYTVHRVVKRLRPKKS